jgi:hypothetical protein
MIRVKNNDYYGTCGHIQERMRNMKQEIIDNLEEQITREISDLYLTSSKDPGYEKIASRIDQLIKTRLEIEKFDAEKLSNAVLALTSDSKAKNENVDRIVKYSLEFVGIMLPIIASWVWMGRGLRFEETGSYTSKTRQWLSGFLKFKK